MGILLIGGFPVVLCFPPGLADGFAHPVRGVAFCCSRSRFYLLAFPISLGIVSFHFPRQLEQHKGFPASLGLPMRFARRLECYGYSGAGEADYITVRRSFSHSLCHLHITCSCAVRCIRLSEIEGTTKISFREYEPDRDIGLGFIFVGDCVFTCRRLDSVARHESEQGVCFPGTWIAPSRTNRIRRVLSARRRQRHAGARVLPKPSSPIKKLTAS